MILPCSIKHAVAHMSAEADTFVKAHANLVFQACRRGLPFLDVEWYIPFPPLDASTYDTFVKAHTNLVFQACRRGLPFLDVEWYIPFPPLDASTYVSGGRYFYQSSCQSRFSDVYLVL